MNAEVEKLWMQMIDEFEPALGIKEFGQACYDEGYLQGQKNGEEAGFIQARSMYRDIDYHDN